VLPVELNFGGRFTVRSRSRQKRHFPPRGAPPGVTCGQSQQRPNQKEPLASPRTERRRYCMTNEWRRYFRPQWVVSISGLGAVVQSPISSFSGRMDSMYCAKSNDQRMARGARHYSQYYHAQRIYKGNRSISCCVFIS